jgi:hypothetical protein
LERPRRSEVNVDKTEIILLGGFSHWNLPIEYMRYIVKLSTIIGIPWMENGVDGENYWKKAIVKIGKIVTIWEKRRLSFVGKVLVINTVLLSKPWYGARVIKLPKKMCNKINSIILNSYGQTKSH